MQFQPERRATLNQTGRSQGHSAPVEGGQNRLVQSRLFLMQHSFAGRAEHIRQGSGFPLTSHSPEVILPDVKPRFRCAWSQSQI
jgi:hypothetical protein